MHTPTDCPATRDPLPLSRRCADRRGDRRNSILGVAGVAMFCACLALAQTTRADDDPIISVTGVAERRVSPDMALLRMAVVTDALNPADARQDADATVSRVLVLLREQGIADGDIDAGSLQVSPQYRWREEQRDRQLTGYRVTRDLSVRLTDLDLLGELLVGLSEAGVNQIQPPEPGLQDPETLYREVLASAAENARARAEVLAATLGETLGGVVSVQTQELPRPAPMQREAVLMAADSGAGGASSYRSGDLSFRVQVFVTFALDS